MRNWREYEAGLRNRGSLTVWISLTAGKLVNWDAPRPRRRKPGRQRKYSNHAIETAVTLGMVFHLSSRQSEGLLRSLFALMKLDNDVPDHTTISRRKAKLGKVPFYQDKQKTPLHILIDSSGLAAHAGQLRRAPKSRDYRKLHLCVDEQTGEVVAGELTSKRARDSSRVASLVGQIDSPISSARADTAYDASGVYEAIENHSAHRSPRVLIPPRKGAQLASGPASSRQRNRNIAAQARLGKRKWHTESGYSKRSKVETTFHRYKAIVGSAMRARGLAAQRVEARIGCKILNTMTALGMPDSETVEFLEDKTGGKVKILAKGPPPEIRKDWKYKGSRANLNEDYEYKYMTKYYWHKGPKRPTDVPSKNGTHNFDGTELTSMALEKMAGEYPHYFAEDARDLFDFIFRRVIHPVEYAAPATVKKRSRPAGSGRPTRASPA